MNENVLTLLNDDKFLDALKAKETAADVVALFAENGVTITEEEVIKMRDYISKSANGELSEDDLENIAGGSKFTDAMKKVDDWFDNLGREISRW